jgi:DNA topoisomerase I
MRSLPSDKDPESLTVEEAVELLRGPAALGQHEETGLNITLHQGRFGPYYKHGSLQFSVGKLPDGEEPSLEHAIARLDKKAERLGVIQHCSIVSMAQWNAAHCTAQMKRWCVWYIWS